MIPSFPRDATALSILAAVKRLAAVHIGGEEMVRLAKQYARCRAQNIDVDRVSVLALNGVVPAEVLARDHSSLAFHGKFLSRMDETEWHKSVAQKAPLAAKNMREQARLDVSYGRELRYCADCAMEDSQQHGCPHWRVGHQLGGIYHCPTHQTSLLGLCAECRMPFGLSTRRLHLPGDPCRICGCQQATSANIAVPVVYWKYLELCRRALIDQAPELRPATRMAVVSSLNARMKTTGRAEPLHRQFLRSWGVSSVNGLQKQFEAKVNERAFERLIESGVACAPNQVIAAVVSFAISNLPSMLLAEAIKESNDASTMPTNATPPSLERLLATHAALSGIPVEVAKSMAAGVTRIGGGLATSASMGRFFAGLSEETRLLVFAARANAKGIRRKKWAETVLEYVAMAREAAMKVLSAGDRRRCSIPLRAYTCLMKHDRPWLDAHFPKPESRPAELMREQRRTAALQLKAKGAAKRGQLRITSVSTYAWLMRHDRQWFDENFPPPLKR